MKVFRLAAALGIDFCGFALAFRGSATVAAGLLLGLLFMTAALPAQPRLQFGQPVDFGINGFHLYNVTGAMSYSSIAGPIGAGSGLPGVGGDYIGYASLSAGYSRTSTNGSFSITYSPGYVAHIRYSELHFLNQNLNIALNRRLNSQWTAFGTLVGDDATLENFLFAPATAGLVVGAPGSTGGVEGGPAAVILFGNRVRSATAVAGLIYRPTTRLRMTFDGETTLQQYKRDANTAVGAIVPRNFYVGGQVTMGYSLTPRTELGLHAVTTRNTSTFGEYQNTFMLAYLYHRWTPHWSTSIGAGPALTNYLSGQVLSARTSGNALSYAAAATASYDLGENRFNVTYGRSAGDAYGLGTGATNAFGGSWDVRSLRTGWSAKAFGGQERFTGGFFTGLVTSHAGASVTRSLGQQWAASLEYSYVQYTGGTGIKDFDAHVARLSVTWVPFLRDAVALRAPRPAQLKPGDPVAP